MDRTISKVTIVFFLILSIVPFSQANNSTTKLHTPQEYQRALEVNTQYIKKRSRRSVPLPTDSQITSETENFKYLLIEGRVYDPAHQMYGMHRAFAQNLPPEMSLIVVTEEAYADNVKNYFLQWIDEERLIVAVGNNIGDTKWSRDSYPIAVYKNTSKDVELVAHKYFRFYNADDTIFGALNTSIVSRHNFIYVGGNLMADENGNCFAVNSDRIFKLDDLSFQMAFRCKSITRLDYLAGIGDVDEVIKLLPNKTVLTNQKKYVNLFERKGYTVKMLPSANGKYRTYANSTILNGTVFMPTYDDPALDTAAKEVYEAEGYKVIGIPSSYMSDRWYGSIHCLTMAYPTVDIAKLFSMLGLSRY